MGGLHDFMAWDGPILTDSGGYQVFSLTSLVRVNDEGAWVKSHLDGEPLFLGPREVMAIQESLGADLVMAFDHCLGLPASEEDLARAVERTTWWARACVEARTRADQALFGIVQGGTSARLRERSARDLVELGLPGYAIGGLAVGEGAGAMRETVRHTCELLPADRPRYLMGVGTPPQVLESVAQGIDLFDCVLPTRMGRRGHLFTRDGVVRITSRLFERAEEKLDPDCACETCRTYSRAYLRHLFSVNEHTATTLGSLHNLHFYLSLLADARRTIQEGRFAAFSEEFVTRYEVGQRRWDERIARDPHGREGSRIRRAEQEARRRDRS
jgi:queuine tRNA-ribosyltransferase